MRYLLKTNRNRSVLLLIFIFLFTSSIKADFKCPNNKNDEISDAELKQILQNHVLWLKDDSQGKKAVLCNLDLSGVNLSKAKLFRANLQNTNLRGANIERVLLGGANLSQANLYGVNGVSAQLDKANLSGAILDYASLNGVSFIQSNLSGASFLGASLRNATLANAHAPSIVLIRADLESSNLTNAHMNDAKLLNTRLVFANLTNTVLIKANLSGANLSHSTLVGSNLTDSIFTNTNLEHSQFEPISVPASGTLGGIKGLDQIHFSKNQRSGMSLLRAQLKQAGLRESEREATYTIEKLKTERTNSYEKLLRKVLFEFTTEYGRYPSNALLLLLILYIIFSAIYIIPLIPYNGSGQILKIESVDYIPDDGNTIELTGNTKGKAVKARSYLAYFYAMEFSLISTFHVGWRDFQIGEWLKKIQSHPYTLEPRGWVRVVSGFQTLISLYLLIIFFLTYFGRPFE